MKVKDKFLNMYRGDRVLLGEWILAIATALLLFVTIGFVDMQSLTVWSTNVWDALFSGNIRDLYAISAKNTQGLAHQYLGSELLSVFPWSVWNLPIWIIQNVTGKQIGHSALMLAYSKSFLVVLTLVVLRYTKKITMFITNNKNKAVWAAFLSFSSVHIYLGVFYAGQNDIIMITASVIAVYMLLKKRNGFFLLWSAIAIAIKPFFLFPFLAVLLLVEKRFIHIIWKVALSVSGVVFQKILFSGAPMYTESMEQGPSLTMMQNMFPSNLKTSFGDVSLLAVSLVLIYFYCYTRRFDDNTLVKQDVRQAKYIIYMITVTYMAYLMFCHFNFYRVALFVPYLYIVLVQNDRMPFFNGIFDFTMSLGLLFKLSLRGNTGLFKVRHFSFGLTQRLFGYSVPFEQNEFTNIEQYMKFNKSLLYYYQPLFSGIAFVSAILLLLFNHPEWKIKAPAFSEKRCRALLWVKILMIVPLLLLSMYLFMNAPIKIYD